MVDKQEYKDVWVYIEVEQGQAKSVGYELLAPGRELAEGMKCKLVAVVIGSKIEEIAKKALSYGADSVIVVDDESYNFYNTERYTYALHALVEKYKPSALLIGATNNGRDLGPRLSCRLETGLTADCTAIAIDEESGNVAWTRPAFGGNLMATILCPDHRPQIGTVRPGVFKKPEIKEDASGSVIEENIRMPDENCLTKTVERIEEVTQELVNLEDAEIIVSGGAGMKGPENFAILKELADALGGTVGASRAAVDSGWVPHVRQVGQTGKTVQPTIYIACGISGAIQHLAGMSSSDVIIAINKDADASICKMANYAIIGDLFEIVPAITAEVKKLKS